MHSKRPRKEAITVKACQKGFAFSEKDSVVFVMTKYGCDHGTD